MGDRSQGASRRVDQGLTSTRRNVLLIMADQLAASWLPAYGRAMVHAPNLTALAREGLTFEHAYCTSPLCAPSRSAILTGRLASRIGVFDNAAELAASTPTVAHHLRAAGYHTCLVGKMHFVGPDQLHGFEERLTPDIYPAGLDWIPDWRAPAAERQPWYHTMAGVLRPGVCEASLQTDYDDEVAFRAVRKLFDLARYRRDEPFFLVASFTNPHDPWEIGRRYWDLYRREALDPPTVAPIPSPSADPHTRRLQEMYGAAQLDLTDEQVLTARHGYCAAISYLDERVGEVLAALDEAGLTESTLVVFTADHGEMLGERGLWYKMNFFEPSIRVPLVVRAPGARGARRVADPVSLVDLAPTLIELAGDREGSGMDGASLLAYVDGRPPQAQRDVAGEYLAEGVAAPLVMVRRGRFKLVCCDDDPDQLYDLEADPHELVNLAGSSAHAGVHHALREAIANRWDLRDLGDRVLASQDERRLIARALNRGAHTSWDFLPEPDGAMRYVRSRADLYELQRLARLDSAATNHPSG
jgi:choline-sulfatase